MYQQVYRTKCHFDILKIFLQNLSSVLSIFDTLLAVMQYFQLHGRGHALLTWLQFFSYFRDFIIFHKYIPNSRGTSDSLA